MHHRFFQSLLCSFLAISLFHAISVRGKWLPYSKGESNFFSSLARSQAALHSEAPIAVLGSSITGRVPGVEAGNPSIANFGADGQTFQEGLSWMVSREKSFSLIVFETNKIHGVPKDLPTKNLTFWRKLGARVPEISAYSRPSARLYSLLRGDSLAHHHESMPLHPVGTHIQQTENNDPFVPSEEEQNLLALCKQLQEQGSRIALVEYPAGVGYNDSLPARKPFILWLSRCLSVDFYDYSAKEYKDMVSHTDSVHLDSTSAVKFANTFHQILLSKDNHE